MVYDSVQVVLDLLALHHFWLRMLPAYRYRQYITVPVVLDLLAVHHFWLRSLPTYRYAWYTVLYR